MRMLRITNVMERRGNVTPTSVYNDVRCGLLTQPVKIGVRSVAWPEHEIDALRAAQIAGRTPARIKQLVNQLHAAREQLAAAEGA